LYLGLPPSYLPHGLDLPRRKVEPDLGFTIPSGNFNRR
jgi:hypothetical protein